MFHFVANCQEGICMQSVMEMSIQSFTDEVFKLTYLIAETTEVNANAQNQELLLQKGKCIESNCVYMYRIDKILDLLWLSILPRYMKKDKKFLHCGFLVTTEKIVVNWFEIFLVPSSDSCIFGMYYIHTNIVMVTIQPPPSKYKPTFYIEILALL